VKKNNQRWGMVENFKRRRALPPSAEWNSEARFFERLLSSRKIQELVFVPKTAAKGR
jgi:hypothetical protein